MYYFCYRTTNTINGKTYIGVHQTNNLNDGYLGSGIGVKRAISKYGSENFHREILKTFDNHTEMYEYEAEIITEEVVKDKNTYNDTLGGKGGWFHCNGENKTNPMATPEARQKVSEAMKKITSDRRDEWLVNQKKATEAARIANTGKKRPQHSALLRKRAETKPPQWLAVTPAGESIFISSLTSFCKENGFVSSSIYGAVQRGATVSSGEACGWYFSRLK